jgi:hypothetical protein
MDDASPRQVSTGCIQRPGLSWRHLRRLVQKPDPSSACIISVREATYSFNSFWSLDVSKSCTVIKKKNVFSLEQFVLQNAESVFFVDSDVVNGKRADISLVLYFVGVLEEMSRQWSYLGKSDHILFPETELAKQNSDFQIRKKSFVPAQKDQIALNATAQLQQLRSTNDH